ncbi:Nitrite reductase [NAD(P)H] small subunit protein [Minicystis rosea]|nr:Nitrite reductase [NAD(P)H] small subunit protein [Minicystis rosea]
MRHDGAPAILYDAPPMKHQWIDLGPLADFPAGEPVLRKDSAGRRFACVREGDTVHAVDDRCPHQGYPLSQGDVRNGVLTCAWHNWKFETATGACTFGGEPVRRYPTRVEDGRVHLDVALDRGAEVRRLLGSLRAALARDDMGRALRDGLRLGALGLPSPTDGPASGAGLATLGTAFEVVALDGAERAEYGFDHGLAVLADLCAWAERGFVGAEEAFVHGAHAVAEPSRHLGVRGTPQPGMRVDPRASLARLADLEGKDIEPVVEALLAERRDEAEARVRAVVEARGPEAAVTALLPFVARHLYDYGHGAIFLAKALELARRFPIAAVELFAAVTVQLGWATADTALPPFTATREAALRAADLPVSEAPRALDDRRGYEASVLAGDRQAVDATLAALTAGVDPVLILRAVAHAAAVRLRRFDAAWERRLDAEVTVLDVTHAVTFAEAAIALTAGKPDRARFAAQLAVLAAGFVGKLHRADAADPVRAASDASGPLIDAARARDVTRALGVVASLDAPARRASYADLAPFAAFDVAVRPIFYAHAVKTTESLRRLDEADPEADAAYLEALVAYLVPSRPESFSRRTAAVAVKFSKDGRPPEGLY